MEKKWEKRSETLKNGQVRRWRERSLGNGVVERWFEDDGEERTSAPQPMSMRTA